MRGKPSWPLVSALLFLGLSPDEVARHLGLRSLTFWRARTGGVVRAEDVPSWAWKRAAGWVGEERKGVAAFDLFGSDDKAMIANLGMLAVKRSWQILELTSVPYSLEETFLALTATEADRKGGAA